MSDTDVKLLWGRAGGRCSAPGCPEDLTIILESGGYIIGEMAHVIAKKPAGRRGKPEGGADTYDNLILLCPTHHTHIDKAPEGTYPESLLHNWKRAHEEIVRSVGKTQIFDNFESLRLEIARLLSANRAIFDSLGPRSVTAHANPESNLSLVWELRRLDRIVPTNKRILALGDANSKLMPREAISAFEAFRVHAEAYEHHCYSRLDSYPQFPSEFANIFSTNGK